MPHQEPPTRRCGECSLCCRLLPTKEINKPANERCPHQRLKGCAIYRDRPTSCALWSCLWLSSPEDAPELRRPDRCHYVVDMIPDFVTAEPHDGSPPRDIPIIQVWVDPRYPEAHRDPALRCYLERRGREGVAALVRYNAADGFLLVPPAMSHTGDFIEHRSNLQPVRQHDFAEIARVWSGGS